MCYGASNSIFKFPVECPLLAQSGHRLVHRTCPLLGVKRTWLVGCKMSAFDPKRTSMVRLTPFQGYRVAADKRRSVIASFHERIVESLADIDGHLAQLRVELLEHF